MNSRNHIMYGTVSAWFYKFLGGVAPLSAGFRTFSVAPPAAANLTNLSSASLTVGTPYGEIAASWAVPANSSSSSSKMVINVSVPIGTEAELSLPFPADRAMVAEGGRAVWAAAKGPSHGDHLGILSRAAGAGGSSVELTIGPGEYAFEAAVV